MELQELVKSALGVMKDCQPIAKVAQGVVCMGVFGDYLYLKRPGQLLESLTLHAGSGATTDEVRLVAEQMVWMPPSGVHTAAIPNLLRYLPWISYLFLPKMIQ